MTDLEELAEAIFQTAMENYDQMVSEEEDPEARATLAYHRDTAVIAARDYALREAHKALCGSAPSVVH